jgi:hypothetical protein
MDTPRMGQISENASLRGFLAELAAPEFQSIDRAG